MPNIKEIKDKVKSLDEGSKFLGSWEINELPMILWEDEEIEKIAQGNYNNRTGIIVATNKRILFLHKGLLNLQSEDFAYNKITSIELHLGIMFGTIIIYCAGNKANIKSILSDIFKFTF